jgi:hypothetical protein
MTIHLRCALCLLVAASVPLAAAAQSLGDAARKAEQERAKTKDPTKVFTNKDLPDAPPAPPPGQPGASVDSGSSNDSTGTTVRRDERPRDVPDPPPVSSTEGAIEVRKVGGLRGTAIETALTLQIRAGQQGVPLTLVLRAVHEDRLPLVDTPIELEAHFAVNSLFLGKVSFERPHIVLAVGDPPAQAVISGSVAEQQPLDGVADVSATLNLNDLARLEGVSRIAGRVFGADFVLSPGQTRLVGEFCRRARRHPARPAL